MQCFGRVCATRWEKPRWRANKHSVTYWVRFEPEVASFRGDDGSETEVPMLVLQRSTHLRNALNIAEDDDISEHTVNLPAGVLQGWLDSLHDLGIFRDDAIVTRGFHDHESFIGRTVRFLEAADFLDDEDCLNQLVRRAGALLFPASPAQDASVKGVEALIKLPEGLLLHILAACKQPFFRHLEVLPARLHLASLHASFPRVHKHKTLDLGPVDSQKKMDAVGQLLGQLNSLRSLRVSGRDCKGSCCADPIATNAQGLQRLQKLSLSRLILNTKGTVALRKLLKSSTLYEVALDRVSFNCGARQGFLSHVSCLTRLTALLLQSTDLGERGVEALVASFPHLSKLRRLCLARSLVHREDLQQLHSKLSLLQRLQDLDLSCNKRVPEHNHLVPALPVLHSLTHLNLESSGMFRTKDGISHFRHVLRQIEQFTALQSLKLPVNRANSMSVLASIGSLCSLRTLILSKCLIYFVVDKLSLKFSLSKLHDLQELDLGHNPLQRISTMNVDLMPCIAGLQQLTWLSLSKIGTTKRVTLPGLAAALLSLQPYQKLYHLDVSDNQFSYSEATGVAEAVCGFSSLRSLNLSGTRLVSQAGDIFMQSTNLWSLKRLEVRGSLVHSGVCSGFLSQIGNMSGLQSLDIGHNVFSLSDVASLAACIAGLSCLTSLDLAHCDLNDEKIELLAPAIQRLGALRVLGLLYNDLKDEGWQVLLPALDRRPEVVVLQVGDNFKALADRFCEHMHHVRVHTGKKSW